jgi:N-methylhydantoinase B
VEQILDHGELQARKALSELPRGSWTAEDFLDDDGITDEMIPMRVTITIDRARFKVDFTGSSKSVRGPVNLPFGRTHAMCRAAFKSLTTPHAVSNGGHFRPLDVVAPPGSLFNAVYPSPTFTLGWTSTVGLELLFKALAQGMPERLAASSGGDVPGFMMVGTHPDTKRFFAVSNNDCVGWGATNQHDGSNATNTPNQSQVRNTPIEVMEMKTGMFFERLELRTDSGGPGKLRGGLGLRRDIRFISDGELLSVMKKTKTRPWAIAGGEEPESNTMLLFPGTERQKKVGTYRARVFVGDRARNLTAGGGGYGRPIEREPRRVLEDVLDGYVSRGAARSIYKVVLQDNHVDYVATRRARNTN